MPFTERPGQDVGSSDGILNGEVNTDTSDGGHRVCSVANAQKPRPPPLLQPIHAYF
jgi:hypothetical protein